MLETAFVEPELLAGPEHLGHEAQPVLAVEPGALHASMERIWLTRLLHRAFRVATAACSCFRGR